ncbi:MAG: 1-acyl-sn-glycerol-3-phosphate acyltransferase [Paludibacteraceae bacterium]|nr:1-acyl-sn-glycerol-3-phosphate acyltransferase [Paludibacteraceae bacterium]
MENEFDFTEIRPYNDSEVHDAFVRVCAEQEFKHVLSQVITNKPVDEVIKRFLQIKTVEEFQKDVMGAYFLNLIEETADGLTTSGFEKITESPKKHLFISNHRDIILDAALLNSVLCSKDIPTSENAIGDNLCSRPWITELMKLNKSFIVKRSGTKREIFDSSRRLSAYIRTKVTSNDSSIWIAQREGRAKDSDDRMQESLLKMLTMSSDKDFKQGFLDLNIMPISISYEYDACDFLKAKEFQQKRDNPDFKKTAHDDVVNMRTGLTNYKGRIHYEIHDCISPEIDKEVSADASRADVLEIVAKIIDRGIHKGYHFYPGNYVAYDERFGGGRFENEYTQIEKNTFDEYIQGQIDRIDLENKDEDFLREKLLEMYSNPLVNNLEALAD